MNYEDIQTPMELYDFMSKNIKYGFCSNRDQKIYSRYEMNNDQLYEYLLFHTYYLQNPEEVLKSGYGICYDQVEFERKWFQTNGYEVKTYYTPYHNHAFLIYKDDNTYNIFERSIKKYNGIHSKNSLEEAIEEYKKMQLENNDIKDIKLYEYQDVIFGIDIYQFIDLVTKEEKLGSNLKQQIDSLQ